MLASAGMATAQYERKKLISFRGNSPFVIVHDDEKIARSEDIWKIIFYPIFFLLIWIWKFEKYTQAKTTPEKTNM